MAPRTIYTVGGTVQAGDGIYIQRQADDQLYSMCLNGQLAYVLTARQVGKSSLMMHTAMRLQDEGHHAAIVDLSMLGVQGISADQWYLGVITEVADKLDIDFDVPAWWAEHDHLGVTQRMARFFESILLEQIPGKVIVFIDEIDSTLSLPFTDDFYAAIRYIYNNRAANRELQRLSFVLIGVATPSDLISDPQRTPFNVGTRVNLTDFTVEEILPLAAGLPLADEQARAVLRQVHAWTGGHPYLTQRLCSSLAQTKATDVDGLVARTFFGEMSDQDNNIQFVRDMLTVRAPDKMAVLKTYRQILLAKKPIPDEEQSLPKAHLKIAGAVRPSNGNLAVRNRIYRTVFDAQWVKAHLPIDWQRRALIGLGTLVPVLMAIIGLLILTRPEPETEVEPEACNFMIPVPYSITRGFMVNQSPGISMGVPEGFEIKAACSGEVVQAVTCTKCTAEQPSTFDQGVTDPSTIFNDPAWGYGYGNFIIVAYDLADLPPNVLDTLSIQGYDLTGNRLLVRYSALSAMQVTEGARFSAGQLLGSTGRTGNASGPLLGMGTRIGTEWNTATEIDPVLFFTPSPRPYSGGGDDPQRAITEFTRLIRQFPNHAPAYVSRARAYFDLNDLENALADYNTALQLDPTLTDAYTGRATVNEYLGHGTDALADLNKAVELAPDDYAVWYQRAQFYARYDGSYEAALADLDQALALNPTAPDALYERGWVKLETRQYEAAEPDFLAALEGDPTNGDIYYDLARTYSALRRDTEAAPNYTLAYYYRGVAMAGNHDEYSALEQLDLALQRDPTFGDAYIARGRAKIAIGAYDEAIEDFERVLTLPDGDARSAYYYMGAAYRAKELPLMAVTEYSNAFEEVSRDPDALPDATIYNARGEAYMAALDYQSALQDFLIASQSNISDAAVFDNLGMARYYTQQYDLALANFTSALALDNSAPDYYTHRALAYSALGQYESAVTDLTAALRLDVDNIEALLQRGYVQLQQAGFGQAVSQLPTEPIYEAALSDLNRVIELTEAAGTPIARAYYYRGQVYWNQNQIQAAYDDYSRAIDLNYYLFGPHYDRGLLALNYLNDLEAAEEDFSIAIDLDPNSADARMRRAETRHQMNDGNNAVADYLIAAGILSDQGNDNAALNVLNTARAVVVAGDAPDYAGWQIDAAIGQNYYLRADYENAIKVYNDILSTAGTDSEAAYVGYMGLGDAYRALTEYEQSVAAYDALLNATGYVPGSVNADSDLSYLAQVVYGRALTYQRMGRSAEALMGFVDTIAMDPTIGGAYRDAGIGFYQVGNYQAALTYLSEAYDNRGFQSAEVAYYLGVTNGELGFNEDAVTYFDAAIEQDPTYAEAYVGRGGVYLRLNFLNSALDDLNTAIDLNPGDAAAYHLRGYVHGLQGNYEAAIADYDTALGLVTTNAGWYYDRGLAYQLSGNLAAAIRDYGEALHLEPQDRTYLESLGSAQYQNNDYADALTTYEQLLTLLLSTGNQDGYALATTHTTLAAIKVALGQDSAALQDYEQAIIYAAEVGDVEGEGLAYLAKARIYSRTEDWENALAEYRQARALFSTASQPLIELDILNEMGEVQLRQGDTQAAQATFEEVISTTERNATRDDIDQAITAYLGLARIQIAIDDRKQAMVIYKQALALDPTNAALVYASGDNYLQLGDPSSALDIAGTYLETYPDDALGYLLMGRALTEQGDYSQAIEALTSAIDLQPAPDSGVTLLPAYAETYFARALAYHYNGQDDQALADMDTALGIWGEAVPQEALDFYEALTSQSQQQAVPQQQAQ